MNYLDFLKTEDIRLRALEQKDLELLYAWENSVELWEVSETITPFSRDVLQEYISQSHQDIYTAKQLRLMIEEHKNNLQTIGTIDLFDFNPHHKRAGIGIFIDPFFSNNGYASKSIKTVALYARDILLLTQLYAEISVENTKSIHVFRSCGFEITGTRKAWLHTKKGYVDQHILQLLF